MIIDRHRIQRGQIVWALINGSPAQVRFVHLLPYRGFVYSVAGIDDEHEANDEAEFADERGELLDLHIAKELARMDRAMTEIKRLRSL